MIPEPLAQLFAPDRWPGFAFLTARLTGLMLVGPLWSMTALPRSIRGAVTVVLGTLLLPAVPRVALPDQTALLPMSLALEMAVGLAIGLSAAVVVQGATLAGEVVALQTGLSLGPALLPTPDAEVSGLGQIKTILALLVYTGLGGHLMLLRGLADSLQVLPLGGPINLAGGGMAATALGTSLFHVAVQTAAPVMVTLLIVNIALAILSRAVPQLNAMMVAFPVTIGVGLLMLGAAMPLIGAALSGWIQGVPGEISRVIAGFRVAPGA